MSKFVLIVSVLACACGPSNRSTSGDDDGTGTDANTNPNPVVDAGVCASSMVKAQKTPLDIFIMLDHSASMQDSNKWTSVTSAINAFIGQPSLAGVAVGLQYFGVPPSTPPPTCSVLSCTVAGDCGDPACGPCTIGFCEGALGGIGGGDSCVAADYATADVAPAPLPGNAAALTNSIAHHSADGNSTPTEPALAGALQYAKSYAASHAGDQVVVVFATDGDPTGCGSSNSITQAEADATAAHTTAPKIPTYVIGVGTELGNLNGIAAAGGTTAAYLVDTSANAQQQFLDAMNMVQHSALGCQYTIPLPTTGSLDYNQVNVNYTPGTGGGPQTIPNVPSAAQCPASGDAWYYDNNNQPTQIVLCTTTCSKVVADASGEVDIALGCATIIE